MVTVSDPTDPFPASVLGGIPIEELLLDLERFSADPSFGGQLAVERRGEAEQRAWSLHDSLDQSLVVHQGPGSDLLERTLENRVRPPIRVTEPAPIVPVPTLAKYVTIRTVTISDAESQVCGVNSDRSTGRSLNTRTVAKVSIKNLLCIWNLTVIPLNKLDYEDTLRN